MTAGFLEVRNTGNYVRQTFTSITTGAMEFKRSIRPGNSFGPWGSAPISSLSDKVLACFGDSITEFGDYPARAATRLGMVGTNLGFGGCRMAAHSDVDYDKMSMYRLAANVRLIAAAPDMLAALKALADQFGDWLDGVEEPDSADTDAMQAARAAIAKAEGWPESHCVDCGSSLGRISDRAVVLSCEACT